MFQKLTITPSVAKSSTFGGCNFDSLRWPSQTCCSYQPKDQFQTSVNHLHTKKYKYKAKTPNTPLWPEISEHIKTFCKEVKHKNPTPQSAKVPGSMVSLLGVNKMCNKYFVYYKCFTEFHRQWEEHTIYKNTKICKNILKYV